MEGGLVIRLIGATGHTKETLISSSLAVKCWPTFVSFSALSSSHVFPLASFGFDLVIMLQENKMKLAQFIEKQWGLKVNPSSMFDVQVGRHVYCLAMSSGQCKIC